MSTKIGEKAAKALKNKYKFYRQNTSVYKDEFGDWCMILYSSIIAKNGPYGIEFNFKGWITQTTVDRIQAITNLHFTRRKGVLYFRDVKLDDYTWYRLDDFMETIKRLRKEQQNDRTNASKDTSMAS